MSAPSFALSEVRPQEATNPLGLVRIDHFQMTGSLERLENLYRRVGFARVASGKAPWGRAVHLHQNRMDILIFDADSSHPAGRYFQAHGEGVCSLNFEVEIMDVREATAEELDHGHVHGPGGHHH